MVYRTKEEMMRVLGDNLRALRIAVGLSQQEAAESSGISVKAVRNLDSGANSSTLSLLAYCRTLRQTDWIMQLAPPMVDEALFTRKDPLKKRQRVSREKRKGASHV